MVARAKAQITALEFSARLAAIGTTMFLFAERIGLSVAMVSLNCRSHTPSASHASAITVRRAVVELRALLQTTDERVSKRNLQAALAAAEPETRQPPRRKVVKRSAVATQLPQPKIHPETSSYHDR